MATADHDRPDESWQRAAKETLRPWRDRLVLFLGGTMPERALTYEQLVHLLYPILSDELRSEVDEAAKGDLASASTIRRMLGSIEHQLAPTAFSVQLTGEDAVRCVVGQVELFCDAADGLRTALPPGHDRGRRRRKPRLLLVVGLQTGGTDWEGRCAGAEFGELPPSAVVVAFERKF
jgi:hypothetical protein